MEIIRIGSKGEAVKELQNDLNKQGYTIEISGIFDDKTEDVVIAFQKKSGLTPDGIVGKITWTRLKNLQNNDNKFIINKTKYVLTTKNYHQEIFKKFDICLHHTAGWTIQKGSSSNAASMNHFNWWASRDLHVATAYSIDYYGNIYEHFDPKYWAYHLGIGGKLKFLDQRSIGIEICNEGPMKLVDGKYYWVTTIDKDGDGKAEEVLIPYNRMQNGLNDVPLNVPGGWRGYDYYAPYSQAQFESTLWLTKYLCDKFGIKKNFIANNEYRIEILQNKFQGIYNHANCRRDKFDLSPAFPFEAFKNNL